jgi:predicted Rossmann-fold nucleotide-binding protein
VEIPIQTHLPGSDPKRFESRNHINALTAAAVIALPGGRGTLAEMEVAIGYGKKCVAFVDEVNQITGLSESASFSEKGIKVVNKEELISFLDKVAPKKSRGGSR